MDARPVNVLVVTNMYPTEREPWSGVFVAEQVEDLRALGVEVSVCSFDGRTDWKEYLRAMATLRRMVAADEFDLVHAHYGLTGAVALAQRQAPVITTFWGSDTFIAWQRAVSYLVARLTAPLFVSEAARARLRRRSAPVVPSAVDTERFRPRPRSEARRLLGWDEGGVYVLLPGSRRSAMKNAALFDASLDALPRELGVRRIALEGYSRDEVAAVMNAVDVTLMTSLSEGSPVAVRESLACETPVVSVRVGDVPELVRDLPGCAVCERDPTALAQAVLRALEAGRGRELRERAVEYSRERVARKVLAVYERAARGGG
jgi:Glycosyl transferases group 1/Glycosyltransferase Family 4